MIYKYRQGQVDISGGQTNIKFKFPKILIFDIETAPLSALVWRLNQKWIPPASLIDSSNYYMLSWSAKWLFSEEVMSDVVTPEEVDSEDDYRIALSLWHLINEADIIISHNGKNFDHKMMNGRWLVNGIKPPTSFKVIDTYQVAKQSFLLPSYSLDYIATKVLGLDGKMEHEGMEMWKKAIRGDQTALTNMSLYNDQDVKVLEDVYLIFRPWIKNHPNIGLFSNLDTPVCHCCGSTNLTHEGHYNTSVSRFKTLRCADCDALSRQRTSEIPKEIRKILVTGVPGDR
jgi:DNA polymerase elongation subunit (family B)